MNTEPESNASEDAQSGSTGEHARSPEADTLLDADHPTDTDVTIESLQAQLAEAEKRILMAHADLENFRRRTRRDMEERIRYAPIGLIGELLDSVDNLNRAIESYETDPNGDGLVEGVKMVAQQIRTILENHGCKKIESVGHPFDPTLHQAVQMQASDDYGPNIVMMDMRPGFQLHDRVIRPAQVFVSTGPEKK